MVRLTVERIENFPFVAAKRCAIFRQRRAFGPALFIDKITVIVSMKDGNLQSHGARGESCGEVGFGASGTADVIRVNMGNTDYQSRVSGFAWWGDRFA